MLQFMRTFVRAWAQTETTETRIWSQQNWSTWFGVSVGGNIFSSGAQGVERRWVSGLPQVVTTTEARAQMVGAKLRSSTSNVIPEFTPNIRAA